MHKYINALTWSLLILLSILRPAITASLINKCRVWLHFVILYTQIPTRIYSAIFRSVDFCTQLMWTWSSRTFQVWKVLHTVNFVYVHKNRITLWNRGSTSLSGMHLLQISKYAQIQHLRISYTITILIASKTPPNSHLNFLFHIFTWSITPYFGCFWKHE